MDDRRMVSGIVYVIPDGSQWKDAPKDYGPRETHDNRFIRGSASTRRPAKRKAALLAPMPVSGRKAG